MNTVTLTLGDYMGVLRTLSDVRSHLIAMSMKQTEVSIAHDFAISAEDVLNAAQAIGGELPIFQRPTPKKPEDVQLVAPEVRARRQAANGRNHNDLVDRSVRGSDGRLVSIHSVPPDIRLRTATNGRQVNPKKGTVA